MAKRGRPRGLNINPVAVEDLLKRACMSKAELSAAAEISTGHLADMLYRRKGTSPEVVRRMASALRCEPGTLAPSLTSEFVSVRMGDDVSEAAS